LTFQLLLDLDDTLLDTNIDTFLPAYFKSLTAHAQGHVAQDVFAAHLMKSTQVMYASKQANLTLEQAFDSAFYPNIGRSKHHMAEMLEEYYDNEFPKLGIYTRQIPQAIDLVQWAIEKGWQITVATDPLFPRKAILSRLRWAGLEPAATPFRFISDFHTFHFAKSSVAYYPELLAWLNWNNEPLLMVGDSMERDINPSLAAGIPVFWLTAAKNDSLGFPNGTYDDLKAYLESTDLETLRVDTRTSNAQLAFLLATPAFFHSYLNTAQLSPEANSNHAQVIFDLCDAELEVNTPWVKALLRQPTDPAEEEAADTDSASEAFDLFYAARQNLLTSLRQMPAEQWQEKVTQGVLQQIVAQDRVFLRQAYSNLHS
jgi:FMN phosphatase YigB (HAD superfamily)